MTPRVRLRIFCFPSQYFPLPGVRIRKEDLHTYSVVLPEEVTAGLASGSRVITDTGSFFMAYWGKTHADTIGRNLWPIAWEFSRPDVEYYADFREALGRIGLAFSASQIFTDHPNFSEVAAAIGVGFAKAGFRRGKPPPPDIAQCWFAKQIDDAGKISPDLIARAWDATKALGGGGEKKD